MLKRIEWPSSLIFFLLLFLLYSRKKICSRGKNYVFFILTFIFLFLAWRRKALLGIVSKFKWGHLTSSGNFLFIRNIISKYQSQFRGNEWIIMHSLKSENNWPLTKLKITEINRIDIKIRGILFTIIFKVLFFVFLFNSVKIIKILDSRWIQLFFVVHINILFSV